jgi:hypothetical protein
MLQCYASLELVDTAVHKVPRREENRNGIQSCTFNCAYSTACAEVSPFVNTWRCNRNSPDKNATKRDHGLKGDVGTNVY